MSYYPTFENPEIQNALLSLFKAWRANYGALDHDIEQGGFTEKDVPGMFLDNLEDGLVDREIWEEFIASQKEVIK